MNDTKNDEHLSWSEYFIKVAELTAKRSKDPSCKVGCVIVNPQKRIVATGYNGMVNCTDNDSIFPWDREGVKSETKYAYVVHAEANAILNATASLKNSRMFVTRYPCCECAKIICQTGIKIVYHPDEPDLHPNAQYCQLASSKMFEACGIRTKQLVVL